MKSVQISYDLFVDLVLYHLNGEDDFDEEIRQDLEEQREQAQQEHLDRRGVPQSYRWTTSPWER